MKGGSTSTLIVVKRGVMTPPLDGWRSVFSTLHSVLILELLILLRTFYRSSTRSGQ